ncbi:TonB-dependent receptor [Mitsuaria sp. GD03876]|uniref:TonB-dependent receptor plug domain-containing protein n=1 Tax=Mitsuaria sp. GD03876 TaxID=2975399 RepID=UPI0024484746|nr:TonB-dependent receptor [Mitsuaria sp. GD03876]MDH0864966.1 TonB-dependent receptor [Mitsuaria sp. GD03876]
MRKNNQLSLSLSAAAALLCCAQVARAQEQDTTQLQRVEVTGSNIKRLASETASPVQVYNRDEIRRTGANTVRQVLDTLTSTSSNEIKDDGSNTSFASGASGVSMRGLGKGATLVLLNGRRVANFGLADGAKDTFVNVDSIPADAVERVEILKDGASAIYGSDAMAGVINIITRRSYNGVGVSGSVTFNEHPSDGAQRQASIVAGFGDLDKDRFNVFANLEAYKRDGYTVGDVKDSYPAWHKGIYLPSFGDPSLNSFPGNLRVNGQRVPVQGCTTLNASGQCVTDVNGLNPVSDPAERVNFFSAGRLKITEDIQAFAEASYSKTTTEYRNLPMAIGAGSTSRWYDGYNKVAQSVPHPVLSATNPANPTGKPVGIDYRFMDDPSIFNYDGTGKQYRVLTGLQGTFRDMDWEVSVGRNAADAEKLSRWGSRDLFAAVASGEYKIGGPNSKELLDRLFPVNGSKGKNHQTWVDAKLSGELMQLPGGPLAFAVGAEHRQEGVSIKSTDNVLRAEIVGRGSVLIDGKRNLDAAFLELNAPVWKGLELNGALRFDKASGFDGRVSPKFGVRYEVSPQLLLRGTVAGGFRAPNIPETLGQVGVTGFFNNTVDPRRCETATKLRDILKKGTAADQSDATAAYNSGCLASVPAMISANPNLKPETSKSITVGFVFEPTKNASIAVDYFKIERKNEISSRDPSYVLAREGKAGYENMISRGPVNAQEQGWIDRANQLSGQNLSWPAGQITSLLLQYENFGKTETSGVDIDLKGRVAAGSFGTLNLGVAATYALTYKAWDIDANTWRPNQVGLYENPRLKAVFSAAWNKGPWTTGLRFNYTSKTQLNKDEADAADWDQVACQTRLKPGSLPCFIDEDLRTDFSLSYTGFKNVRLSLNILNLMGDERPVNLRDGYKLRPRSYKVGASYDF